MVSVSLRSTAGFLGLASVSGLTPTVTALTVTPTVTKPAPDTDPRLWAALVIWLHNTFIPKDELKKYNIQPDQAGSLTGAPTGYVGHGCFDSNYWKDGTNAHQHWNGPDGSHPIAAFSQLKDFVEAFQGDLICSHPYMQNDGAVETDYKRLEIKDTKFLLECTNDTGLKMLIGDSGAGSPVDGSILDFYKGTTIDGGSGNIQNERWEVQKGCKVVNCLAKPGDCDKNDR